MKNKLLKNLKILFVEDEEKIASSLKNAIGDEFRSFLIAKDGLEGMDLFSKTKPDVVISDITMPKMDGLEMAKQLKKINPDTPIIILSAYSDKDKLFAAIDVGVTKYFLKPYDPDELLDYIIEIAPTLNAQTVELVDGYSFNKTTSSLYKDAKFVSLTKNEIKFMLILLDNMDRLVDDKDIKTSVWEESVTDERLRTFIRRLRTKTSKSLVENVKGAGYRLVT